MSTRSVLKDRNVRSSASNVREKCSQGQKCQKQCFKCPREVFSRLETGEEEVQMSARNILKDKIVRSSASNVREKCSQGQKREKKRFKCPREVFSRPETGEEEVQMSTRSVLKDSVVRSSASNVREKCSQGQKCQKQCFKCPREVFSRLETGEEEVQMSARNILKDKIVRSSASNVREKCSQGQKWQKQWFKCPREAFSRTETRAGK
ncbi:hypothetical protein [Virgibacillus kimchii]